jgi:hypothetical protein
VIEKDHNPIIKKSIYKKWWFWVIAIIVVNIFIKLTNPSSHPVEAQTLIIELYKVQISEFDFNVSSFGNPLDLEISLLENSEKIKSVLLSGKRGERVLDQPVQWIINYNPSNNYQLTITEQAVIAKAVSWKIPATPKIGYWPISRNKGKINFGKESILFFRELTTK